MISGRIFEKVADEKTTQLSILATLEVAFERQKKKKKKNIHTALSEKLDSKQSLSGQSSVALQFGLSSQTCLLTL